MAKQKQNRTDCRLSTNKSEEHHLLHLNDDCFYEIYKLLPIIDWCSLRETCTRLQTISDDCFKRQSHSFVLNSCYITDSLYPDDLKMKDVRNVFRNFGQHISKLKIKKNAFSPNEDLKQIIPLLHRYCISLKDLKLVTIEFDAATVDQCKSLFSNLERLVIDNCNDNNVVGTCLAHSKSLKELELIRLYDIDLVISVNQHDTLETFVVKSCDFNSGFILDFLVKNPQLKNVKFVGCLFITNQLTQHISHNLPHLEALSLRFVQVESTINENIMQLLCLTKLKKFEMNCGFIVINEFLYGLAAQNRIEMLHLSTMEITNESNQALCSLKSLKVLKFTSTTQLDENACRKLAAELPVLSEIHIIECSGTTFNELKHFAEYSITLKKLVFVRYSEDTPSLTKNLFLSLIEARRRNPNKEILNVHLEYHDHRDMKDQFIWDGNLNLFTELSHVINLLPIKDEEDKFPMFEYVSGNRKEFRAFFDDVEFMDGASYGFDDEDLDDDFDDDFDNDFDDDFL